MACRGSRGWDFPLLQVVLALAELNLHLPLTEITTSSSFVLSRVKQLHNRDTAGNIKIILRTLFFHHPTRYHPSLSTDNIAEAKPQLTITVACHSDPPSDQMLTLATQA